MRNHVKMSLICQLATMVSAPVKVEQNTSRRIDQMRIDSIPSLTKNCSPNVLVPAQLVTDQIANPSREFPEKLIVMVV